MDCYKTLILLFFGCSLNSCSRFLPRKYYLIDVTMTWTDAQQLCRENYTDLATFENMDDINSFTPTFSYLWAWIGLSDDPQSWKYAIGNESNSWRWSPTGETSKTGYSNWAIYEPNNYAASESCGIMGAYGQWNDYSCLNYFNFICYDVINETERTYVLITATEQWETALEYCRTHHTDLAMIESIEQNNEVNAAKSGAQAVWIGLYRVPWVWSDKSQSSFKNWQSTKPNNYGNQQFCIAMNNLKEWDDDSCQNTYPVICHQVARLRKMVRVKFQSNVDISDPAVNTQILQQLSAALASWGWTDVNLKWRIQPKKLVEDGVKGGQPNNKAPPGQN